MHNGHKEFHRLFSHYRLKMVKVTRETLRSKSHLINNKNKNAYILSSLRLLSVRHKISKNDQNDRHNLL